MSKKHWIFGAVGFAVVMAVGIGFHAILTDIVRDPRNQSAIALLVALGSGVVATALSRLVGKTKGVMFSAGVGAALAFIVLLVMMLFSPYLPRDIGWWPFRRTLVIADFDQGTVTNDLDGYMGAAYDPNSGDHLLETYVPEGDEASFARLEYEIANYAAFWLQLNEVDLTEYRVLSFDIRADPSFAIPGSIEIQWRRNCPGGGGQCVEVEAHRVSGITQEWRKIAIPLEEFGWSGHSDSGPLKAWDNVEQLAFVFHKETSGSKGCVYLDNIVVYR